MISAIRGTIQRFGPNRVHLETPGGVEYEVQLPLNVFESLQSLGRGSDVHLYIYHKFYQEDQRLFGFLDSTQRELFESVQTIKGIGPALALSILSHMGPSHLLEICERKDITAMSRIPRVGKSTAETVIFEVGRRLDSWRKKFPSDTSVAESDASRLTGEEDLALQALTQLGYRENQIRAALEKLKKESGAEKLHSASEWITQALRYL